MTRDEILNEIFVCEARARFYDAAETQQWFRQTADREANAKRLRELMTMLGRL